ncbi:hypothetical protein [Sulfurimonas sp. HSL-1716]|uniref:hypothetical protein n=1 Tax=Hydrocurvibacter sulfurireducens TaxID=3131937 RepID=UPI0031F8F024
MTDKHIALIAPFGWAGVSTPIVSSVEYLHSFGYKIDLYYDKNEACNRMGLNEPLFNLDNVNIYFYDYKGEDILEEYIDLQVNKKDLEFIDFITSKDIDYDFLIGYDEEGLIRAGIYGLKNNIRFYYHSLEFYEREDQKKVAEKFFANKSEGIFTQDKYRAEILSQTLHVPISKLSVVYNSTIGEPIFEKSDFFRDMFDIDKDKKICLVTGTLMSITGVDKILESFKNCSDEFVLVLHGWLPDRNIKECIESAMKSNGGQIYYSNTILEHKDKFKIFASADISFVYYEPVNLNLKYAAWSSGKFFDSVRCGVPVIANNIPNMKTLVEDNGCGIVLDDFNEVQKAFENIMSNYEIYKKNCYKTYLKYDFKESFKNALGKDLKI